MVGFLESSDLSTSFTCLQKIESIYGHPQKVELFKHSSVGKVLVIDDELQHVEAWQAMYHEPLVHLAASFVENIEDVLVIGGGSLFAAFEALKYGSVKRCMLVDHDKRVLETICRHYKHGPSVVNDERFAHVDCDAIDFVNNCQHKFDLIINDCFDITKVSNALGVSYYDALKRLITPSGVCADLIYRHAFDESNMGETVKHLSELDNIALSLVTVPEYPGVLHFLVIWGNEHCRQDSGGSVNNIQMSWNSTGAPFDMQYYDYRFRSYYLYIPPYVKQIVDKLKR